MANTDETTSNAEPKADTIEATCTHPEGYKIIRAKDGTPKPIVKDGHLANVRCPDCKHELWRPGAA